MTRLTSRQEIDASCESLGRFGEELFDQIEHYVTDPTISDLVDRQLSFNYQHLTDQSRLAMESWEAYEDRGPVRGPALSNLLGRGASYTASTIRRAAVLAWNGFTKFVTEAIVELDRTGARDLKRTEQALSQREGDGSGKFMDKSLAQHLSRSGEVPDDFHKWIQDAMDLSRRIVDRLLPESNKILKAIDAALRQYRPGNEASFRSMASSVISALDRLPDFEQTIGRQAAQSEWPGGFGVTIQRAAIKLKKEGKLGRHLTKDRLDFNLYKRNREQTVSGFVPILSRDECEELLRQVTRFINFNRDLARSVKSSSRLLDDKLDGIHLANRIRFILAREKLRGEIEDETLMHELALAARVLKSHTYLTPRTVLRRVLARNLDMIRDSLKYVRESVQRFQ